MISSVTRLAGVFHPKYFQIRKFWKDNYRDVVCLDTDTELFVQWLRCPHMLNLMQLVKISCQDREDQSAYNRDSNFRPSIPTHSPRGSSEKGVGERVNRTATVSVYSVILRGVTLIGIMHWYATGPSVTPGVILSQTFINEVRTYRCMENIKQVARNYIENVGHVNVKGHSNTMKHIHVKSYVPGKLYTGFWTRKWVQRR